MTRSSIQAFSYGLGAMALALAACSSSSDEPRATCTEHTSSAASVAEQKAVSFQNDVLPIFAQSCAFSSCHGSKTGGNNGIYLGARGSSNAVAVREALLGTSSAHMPSMKFVTPYQPAQSFLVHKLEGDFCGLGECADGKCGERMPRGGDPLDPASRDVVRVWIAQGAPDG